MGPLTLLPLSGFALYLSRRLDIDASLGVLYSVSMIVLVLYLGALLNGLPYAALSVWVGGCLMLAVELVQQGRRKAPFTLPVPLALLVTLSVAYWLRYGETKLFFYDEYSHWGIYLKEMIAHDAFWGADTNAMHVRYPPGPPLFQYLFARLAPEIEGAAYLAQFILFLAPLLLLLHGLRWSQWPYICAVLAVGLIAATQFSQGFSSLYVDHIIGSWFAGCLLAFYLSRERSLKIQSLCALPVATLALIKGTGLAFAIAATAIVTIMAFVSARRSRISCARSARNAVLVALAIAGPALACAQLWTFNRDSTGARLDVMSSQTLLNELTSVRDLASSTAGKETTRRFMDVLQHTRLGNNEWFWRLNEYTYVVNDLFQRSHGFTALGALAAFVVWWLILLRGPIDPCQRGIWGAMSGGLLLTAIAYVSSLYVTYLFAFSERGLLLPSYTRYVNTILIAMLFVSFAPLLPGFRRDGSPPVATWGRASITAASLLLIAGVAGLYLYERPQIRRLTLPNPPMELRRHWEPLARQVSDIIGPSRVWIYLPDDRTSEFMAAVVKYLLTPAHVHVESSSAFWQQDTATAMGILEQFDYLWMTAPLDSAPTQGSIQSALKIDAGRLARITRDGRGRVVIGPVTPDG